MSVLRILIAMTLLVAAPLAHAETLTATGSGATQKEACDAAKANAQKSVPQGKTISKLAPCTCTPSHGHKTCTVGATY